MILVIGGIKGGSGKTTLATNLAVMRAQKRKVLLVDADEQRSTSDWSDQRDAYLSERPEMRKACASFVTVSLSGRSIHSQLQKMANDYDDIIVDTGGRDTTSQRSALTIANRFLIPFKPRSLDIWTLSSVKLLIGEIQAVNRNLRCYVVINQSDARGSDNADALALLQEHSELTCVPTFIGSRKALANAAADGLGVVELPHTDEKAISELQSLYGYIYK